MDDTDRQIMELLKEDGRRSNVDIAEVVGVSEGTVRKRIDRLLADGKLRIIGLANPETIGYTTRAMIYLTVELPHVDEVAQALKGMPQVMSLYTVMGEYDIVMETAFRSDASLVAFLRDRVAPLPGVVNSRTCHVAQVLKPAYEWSPPAPPPPRVLIVDDDPDFLEFARMVLTSEGYEVSTASSGDMALQTMASASPDLVVLDIMMDGVLDGWDASGRIRASQDYGDVPILVVSSITSSEYLGMVPTDEDNLIDNFVSKPVDPKRLVSEATRLLRRRQ
jgi:Lrp/AsnC family transcriptional regulator for asnA, asnC and gidA